MVDIVAYKNIFYAQKNPILDPLSAAPKTSGFSRAAGLAGLISPVIGCNSIFENLKDTKQETSTYN